MSSLNKVWSAENAFTQDDLLAIGNTAIDNGIQEPDNAKCTGKKAISHWCPFLPDSLFRFVQHAHTQVLTEFGFNVKAELTNSFLLNRYVTSSGEYPWHNDSRTVGEFVDTKITIIINASTQSYEGGSFHLFVDGGSRHIEYMDKPGCAIMFPSSIYHKVDPVTCGERRSIVLFLSGPRWQ